jgi:hypothetical protein
MPSNALFSQTQHRCNQEQKYEEPQPCHRAGSGVLRDRAGLCRRVQPDVNQQNRIEEGLESGQLSTKEAGTLERQESRVDQMEAHAAADGTVSKAEAARINSAQNALSGNIYDQKHDAQLGNPNSASSTQMQAAVQRDANQEARINQGVKSGDLTTHEAGKLEQGQAHIAHAEANAAANGRMSSAEAARVQRAENRQSHRIHRQKHDQQARNAAGA